MTESSIRESNRNLPAASHAGPAVAAAVDTASPLAEQFREARRAWLAKSPSPDTRANYDRDLRQFLAFLEIPDDQPEQLARILPRQVAEWRDQLLREGLANASVSRKLTVLRSFYSYLQAYGYTGSNPAHSKFVDAPAVPRDGKTVALSPHDCRRLLDAPMTKIIDPKTGEEIPLPPARIRDASLFAVLAYSGVRVGELCRLRVGDYKSSSGLKLLEVHGKGGKERRVALHPEAVERIEHWLDCAGIRDDAGGPLFRPAKAARSDGRHGFRPRPMTRRAVQHLVGRYVAQLKLGPGISVHSFRATALTTAREAGSDIIDLQDFAGHADPATTITYIRNRDRLSKSPAYLLNY